MDHLDVIFCPVELTLLQSGPILQWIKNWAEDPEYSEEKM
jgi:hypothetical protein